MWTAWLQYNKTVAQKYFAVEIYAIVAISMIR